LKKEDLAPVTPAPPVEPAAELEVDISGMSSVNEVNRGSRSLDVDQTPLIH